MDRMRKNATGSGVRIRCEGSKRPRWSDKLGQRRRNRTNFYEFHRSWALPFVTSTHSGTKLMIPVRIRCEYQGTTTLRPHPSDLTTPFANSSATGLRKEGSPVIVLERTSPTLRYMNERLEP